MTGLGTYECYLRSRGFTPCIVDDKALWAYHRAQVYGSRSQLIVLLGASRMQLDIVPRELRRMFPCYDVVQLAIDGKNPLYTLRDLAEDERFHGIVLCSVTELAFSRENWDDQKDFVDYYHKSFTLDKRINRIVKTLFEKHFVIADPYVKFRKVFDYFLRRGRMLPPRYLITFPDRSRSADYSKTNQKEQMAFRIKRIKEIYRDNPPPTEEEWHKEFQGVESLIRKITDRGGRVVFLRLPSTGQHGEIDERFYPKRLYWDRFAAQTSATTIHFKDFPSLERYICPDGSHLDGKDAQMFTRDLARQLVNEGVLHYCAEGGE